MSVFPALSRLGRKALLALPLVALLASFGSGGAVAGPAYETWFRHESFLEDDWQFTEVKSDPNQVIITPRYGSPTESRKRIFVLYPNASTAYDTAISAVLQRFADSRLNAEFLVFTFGGNSQAGKEAIRIAEGGYSMILSMGSKSTAWLWQHYRDKRLPVISVCAKDPVLLGQMESYEKGSGTNFAFTSLNAPIQVQLGYVMELRPNLKNIGILVDTENVSAVETQAKPAADYAANRGIRVIEVGVAGSSNPRDELRRKVSEAVAAMRQNDPTLANSIFWLTGSTAVFGEMKTINAVADRVPVVSVVPELVTASEDSAALSVGVGFESNGRLAAIYAEKVITGKAKVGDLRVGLVSPPDIALNMRKAKEIGLSIPFSWFETASYVYDYEGRVVRTSSRLHAADM